MSRFLRLAIIPFTVIALIAVGCNKGSETDSSQPGPPSGPGGGGPMGKMMGKGPGGGMGGMGQVSPDETDGGKIFAAMCARCHGPAGKGDGPMGRRFQPPPTDLTSAEATKKSDEDLKKVISEGEESMPPFKDNLTAQQIDAVVKFIRALK